jgi:superfamily II DNA or RNA helicase
MIHITIDNVLQVENLPERLSLATVLNCTLKNPEYITRQKLGKWLGDVEPTITLAEYADDALVLPRGYAGRLIGRIKNAGLEYSLDDRRLTFPQIGVTFNGALRPYQQRALVEMLQYHSGILTASCGSGKTCMAAAIIAHQQQPALIIVHTRTLMEQAREAMQKWLCISPGLIGDGVFDIQPVTVGIVQSLAGNAERIAAIRDKFGLVILDEAHHSPASTFTDVLQQFPAKYRYGATATATRRDGLWKFAELVIGPVHYEVRSEELRDAGVLIVPNIEWIRSDFKHSGDDWVPLISALVKDERRNDLLVGLIEKQIDDGRRIIALSERVSHAELLAELVNRSRPRAAVVVTGSMSKKKREEAFERMRNDKARVLFSTRLADEGLDEQYLDCCVLLTPSRSGGRTTQRVGRVLRSLDGKRKPIVIDVVDFLVGLLWSQARTRYFEAYRNVAPGCRLPEWLERSKRKVA